MLLRSHFRFWFLILATVFSTLAQANNENDARLLVHTLNYLGGDYGNAVKNGKIDMKYLKSAALRITHPAKPEIIKFGVYITANFPVTGMTKRTEPGLYGSKGFL